VRSLLVAANLLSCCTSRHCDLVDCFFPCMAASSSSPAVIAERVLPVTPREAGLAVLITLVGIALRCAGLAHCELSHFDEGVYASNVWFGPESGYAYPARHLYAPPLVPALIELSISVLGPQGVAPLLPGVVCGCLLVPLVWWVGRQWFGPAAGLMAATLAAFSGPHAYFTRTALTDAPLGLFLTAAVYLGGEWLQRGRGWRLLGAGICAGLAWWTKYNGWLALAIVGSATPPWLLFRWRQAREGARDNLVPRETPRDPAGEAGCAGGGFSLDLRGDGGGGDSLSGADCPQPAREEVPGVTGLPVGLPGRGPVSRETGLAGGLQGRVSRETDSASPLTPASRGPVPRETDLTEDLSRGVSRETDLTTPVEKNQACDHSGGITSQRLLPGGLDQASVIPFCVNGDPGNLPAAPVRRVSRETGMSAAPLGDVPRETAMGDVVGSLLPVSVSRETGDAGGVLAGQAADVGRGNREAVGGATATAEGDSVSRGTAPSGRRRSSQTMKRETASVPGVISVFWHLGLFLALAGVLWLPVLWGLESAGGYQVVAANHRRYLVGLSGMVDSLIRQFQSLSFLEDLHHRLAWVAGLAVVWSWRGRSPAGVRWWQLLAVAAILCGTLPVTTLAAMLFLVTLFLVPVWSPRARSRWSELPVWLLAAWWVSLSLATPGYTPYPRLTLPWLVASWFAAGAWVGGWLVDESPTAPGQPAVETPPASRSQRRKSGWVLALVGVVLFSLWLGNRPSRRELLTGHSQQGMAQAARDVAEALRLDLGQSGQGPIDALVYLHAEPALLYHLRALGLPVVQPVQDLEFAKKPGVDRAPTFVIVGDRSGREPGFQGPPLGDSRWRQVTRLALAVPPLVWLDEAWEPIPGGTTNDRSLDRPYHLEVWRVGSAPNPN